MQNPPEQDQEQEKQQVQALERARFSKRLTQSEVQRRLIVFPLAAVAGVFDFKEGRLFFVDVVDSLGKGWTFLGTFATNDELGPFVSISWPQLATEKALRAEDEVLFLETAPEDVGLCGSPRKKFKVEIRRKIRLLGKDIWGELMV